MTAPAGVSKAKEEQVGVRDRTHDDQGTGEQVIPRNSFKKPARLDNNLSIRLTSLM